MLVFIFKYFFLRGYSFIVMNSFLYLLQVSVIQLYQLKIPYEGNDPEVVDETVWGLCSGCGFYLLLVLNILMSSRNLLWGTFV